MSSETCGDCAHWLRVDVPEQLMGYCDLKQCRRHRDGGCKDGFKEV